MGAALGGGLRKFEGEGLALRIEALERGVGRGVEHNTKDGDNDAECDQCPDGGFNGNKGFLAHGSLLRYRGIS